jgi:hypothetical protein
LAARRHRGIKKTLHSDAVDKHLALNLPDSCVSRQIRINDLNIDEWLRAKGTTEKTYRYEARG